ncbi:hypothetical protein FQN57_007389 [Myotisia sp. PD_48]|nr:hypothetical protein FQN57_007389 [Myotisia sp. PD_48]
MAQPSSAAHHRHRASLEHIIYFSPTQELSVDQRRRARSLFYNVVNHFSDLDDDASNRDYKRALLLRYTLEYSRSEISQDTFLRAFFNSVELDSIDQEIDVDWNNKLLENSLRLKLIEFADFLLDNFFLPLKATGKTTPQPSPAPLSAVQRALGGEQDYLGTPDRLSTLRGLCLLRDRYRCVISRKFDTIELGQRLRRAANARDEDGELLLGQPNESVEVAHIIPHALMKGEGNLQLTESKKAAVAILDMFDCGIARIIEGSEIDRPFNALTMTHTLHSLFGNFMVYFMPITDQPHTYRIDTFYPAGMVQDLPVTRTLYLTEDHNIDPPLPRLLAIHSAICHILHLSAAGEYIDKVLEDIEKITQQNGSTELGRLVSLGLNGWLDGAIRTGCR